jgi:hypothetical protein
MVQPMGHSCKGLSNLYCLHRNNGEQYSSDELSSTLSGVFQMGSKSNAAQLSTVG